MTYIVKGRIELWKVSLFLNNTILSSFLCIFWFYSPKLLFLFYILFFLPIFWNQIITIGITASNPRTEAFGTQQLQDLSSSLFLSSFPLSLFYLWSLLILSSLSYSILPPNPPNSFSDSFCEILQLTPLIHQYYWIDF